MLVMTRVCLVDARAVFQQNLGDRSMAHLRRHEQCCATSIVRLVNINATLGF